MAVRLRGKPALVRRVLAVEWHRIRREFSYIVETSAANGFEPYWFAGQLAVAEAEAGPGAAPDPAHVPARVGNGPAGAKPPPRAAWALVAGGAALALVGAGHGLRGNLAELVYTGGVGVVVASMGVWSLAKRR